LTASRNATVEGKARSLVITADLNSKPESATLDIGFNETGNLPAGMDNVVVLSAASIAAGGRSGLSLKPGTLTLTFTVPASLLSEAGPDTRYQLVRYDGSAYQVLPANVVQSNGTATFQVRTPDLSGTVTLVMTSSPQSSVDSEVIYTHAPVSTPVPNSSATPAPASSGWLGAISSLWVSIFGTFAIGEVVGATILFGLSKIGR
jgi:hypothetical protein